MADARAWFPISTGLLTWEHYQRLGPAWMVFQWMIHEQRVPKDGEAPGVVRDGAPISYEVIGRCLQGMPSRTVEKHVAVLEREGYIRSEYIRGHGKRYTIANPIRWSMALPRNGEFKGHYSASVGSSDSPEVGSSTPQQWGAPLPKSGEANKEAITNNVITRSKAGAPTPDHLHPLHYADRIIEVLGMTNTYQNKTIIAEAIKAEAKHSGLTPAEVGAAITGYAIRDRGEGVAIDKFYFEDTKWRGNQRKKGFLPPQNMPKDYVSEGTKRRLQIEATK